VLYNVIGGIMEKENKVTIKELDEILEADLSADTRKIMSDIEIDTSKSTEKRSSQSILKELRYDGAK